MPDQFSRTQLIYGAEAMARQAAEARFDDVGLGRDAAIRALANHELQIESISDKTGVPHGGVRPKRERRA